MKKLKLKTSLENLGFYRRCCLRSWFPNIIDLAKIIESTTLLSLDLGLVFEQ